MTVDLRDVRIAADRILDRVAADPRYAHTSHLHVRVGGAVVVDEHRRGPEPADIFSVTKTVLATTLGVLAAQGLLPALDDPVAHVLPVLRGTPAERHTWRQVLTMTRGAEADGPWTADEIAAVSTSRVAHIAAAPQVCEPGSTFWYDNGGPHLLSAAVSEIVGEPLSHFAAREIFDPLGFGDHDWPADPEGYSTGSDGLRLKAADLGLLGQLWLDSGRRGARTLLDPEFFTAMTHAQVDGGPPEMLPYGFLTWVPERQLLAGGWAGQHVLVIPAAEAVVVTTGDPKFDHGPPPSDQLPDDWRPALDLVREHLLPVLPGRGAHPSGSVQERRLEQEQSRS